MKSPAIRHTVSSSIGVIALFVATACGRGDDAATDSSAVSAADTAVPAAAAPAAINDAQIAHIVVTANSIDSAAGVVAEPKATSDDVKQFARMMVTDHGAVNAQAVALATKLGVTPEDNETSRQLMAGATESATKLQGLTGAAFDRAYMEREVGYHEAVIGALDNTLIPNAQNAELKDLLVKSRPAFVAHLERARTVLNSIK